MGIKDVLKTIDRANLVRNLVLLKGHNKMTVETAFSRELISKKLAPDLEELTSISMKFWLHPDLYTTTGVRIIENPKKTAEEI